MTSAPAIGFEYHPSRLLRRVLLLVAALALLGVIACALPTWLKGLLALLVAAAAWRARRSLRRTPVRAAGWSREDGWTLHLAGHRDVPARLLSFRVLGGFVLLRLGLPGRGAQTMLLAPDNMDVDTRRRLRMRLATIRPGEALPRL